MSEELVAPLLKSPRLPQYRQQMQQHLDAEKHRRRAFVDELQEDKKAEFINEEVVVRSPVCNVHAQVSELLLVAPSTFARLSGAGRVGHEKLLVSLTRNDYEPDICFWREAVLRKFEPDPVRVPAPDLQLPIEAAFDARLHLVWMSQRLRMTFAVSPPVTNGHCFDHCNIPPPPRVISFRHR